VAQSVAEWLASSERIISKAVVESVEDIAVFTAHKLRSEVPGNRHKTKASVRHMMTEVHAAKIGFFFSQKYTTNKNAFTYTMFRQIWRDKLREDAKAKFTKTLNEKLKR
jgi:hypothetical protein